MALDFPANPTNGQVYGSYVYNAVVNAWQSREDSATVAIMSAVAPASANNGDLWVNTNDGTSFVYYDDGNSGQWIEILATGTPVLEEGGGATAIALTVNTPSGTASKVSDEIITFEDGAIYIVRFVQGTSVDNPTLNGVNIQLGTTNANITVLSVGANAVVPMIYVAATNKLALFGSQRTSDAIETYLSNLLDVNAPSPTDGNSLVYSTATSKWIPKTISLGELLNVNASSPTNGNSLVFDTATNKWVPNKDTDAIKMNTQTISANYTIPSGYNGMSAGPITIANGVTVTIPDGSSWSIV